jgi:hypothetical protein
VKVKAEHVGGLLFLFGGVVSLWWGSMHIYDPPRLGYWNDEAFHIQHPMLIQFGAVGLGMIGILLGADLFRK